MLLEDYYGLGNAWRSHDGSNKKIDTHSFIESTRTFMPQHTDLYDIDTSDSIQS
jgi:hypothetical protein